MKLWQKRMTSLSDLPLGSKSLPPCSQHSQPLCSSSVERRLVLCALLCLPEGRPLLQDTGPAPARPVLPCGLRLNPPPTEEHRAGRSSGPPWQRYQGPHETRGPLSQNRSKDCDVCICQTLQIEGQDASQPSSNFAPDPHLASAHGQCCECVLEDLLEAQELDHRQADGGVEAQASLVGTNGAAELQGGGGRGGVCGSAGWEMSETGF